MNKRIVIFHHGLIGSGGGERITLEEEKYFKGYECNPAILTFYYNPDIFNGNYNPNVVNISPKRFSKHLLIKICQKIKNLRKEISKIKPDHIIAVGEEGCVYVFFSTLFTKFKYSVHIHQTIFWDIKTYRNIWDTSPFLLGRYSPIFKNVYNEVRNSTFGHRESLPDEPPKMGFKKRLLSEALGFITFKAVSKAKNIFVLSNKMGWEIEKMYKRKSIVLKGAYPESIKYYEPKINIKDYYNIYNKKVLLSLCRLEPKKRVDLIINAFEILSKRRKDVVLIIGGTGSAEEELKTLVKNLKIEDSVIFTGFIDENMLYDYYYYCDVFVSADHADYDITTYTAIGFNKKTVWAIENEVSDDLINSGNVFPANPNALDFSKAIESALDSKINGNFNPRRYSWESYFSDIYRYL